MNYKLLIPSLIFPLLVGALGSIFTVSSINTWYATLNKPFFNPPNFIFGPVWTILYILMGVSFYLVVKTQHKGKDLAVKFFWLQLLLNFFWSFIFFRIHNVGVAFFEIVLLWASIAATIYFFYKISKQAAYLLIPYIAWVSFAAILNLSIFLLN